MAAGSGICLRAAARRNAKIGLPIMSRLLFSVDSGG
jgi:hypothetical protein